MWQVASEWDGAAGVSTVKARFHFPGNKGIPTKKNNQNKIPLWSPGQKKRQITDFSAD